VARGKQGSSPGDRPSTPAVAEADEPTATFGEPTPTLSGPTPTLSEADEPTATFGEPTPTLSGPTPTLSEAVRPTFGEPTPTLAGPVRPTVDDPPRTLAEPIPQSTPRPTPTLAEPVIPTVDDPPRSLAEPVPKPTPKQAKPVRPTPPEPPAPPAGPGPRLTTSSGPAARLTGGAPPANTSADAPRDDANGNQAPADPLSGYGDPAAAGPRDAKMPATSSTDTGNPAGAAAAGVPDGAGFDSDLLDSPSAGGPDNGETGAGDVPEVELSDSEVAEVLSGRVIPIGAFFGGAQSAPAGRVGDDAAEMPGATFLADAGRIAATWARERYLGLTSAAGISIALSACAAAWFSAGSRVDIIRGVAALWGGYLILRAGQWLALDPGPAEAGQQSAVEPDAETAGRARGLAMRRRRAEGGLRRVGPVGWLAALGGAVAECGIYAGLAVGAAAERWGAVWTLAIAVLSLVAVRNLMTACSTPPGFGEESGGAFRRLAAAVLTMPVGGRILLVGVVAPFWGARAALLALLDWAIVSIGYGIAGRTAAGVSAWAGRGGEAGQVAARSKLVRLRDDGALARALGALVRGNLMPLPPALLGLAAVSALALLGLHGLPGVLLIAPAVVMLLAAPGSAHPHTGRFDWLVPVLLLGAQCLYLTATGLAARVPGPVIFALIGAIMLRYTDLAWPGRPVQLARRRDADAEPAERGTGLGWEGRMLFAGLTAAMGVATIGYLALTAYLAVLVCVKAVTTCLAPHE
jgi:hypothetical protein